MKLNRKLAATLLTAGLVAALSPLTASPASAGSAAIGVCTKSMTTLNETGKLFSVFPWNTSGASACYLVYGHTGDGVKALQRNMNACYGKKLVLDGDFGPATRNALVDVQGRVGAAVDGEYGNETRAKMKWARYSNETGARYDCADLF